MLHHWSIFNVIKQDYDMKTLGINFFKFLQFNLHL